jgi:hypothetical protein
MRVAAVFFGLAILVGLFFMWAGYVAGVGWPQSRYYEEKTEVAQMARAIEHLEESNFNGLLIVGGCILVVLGSLGQVVIVCAEHLRALRMQFAPPPPDPIIPPAGSPTPKAFKPVPEAKPEPAPRPRAAPIYPEMPEMKPQAVRSPQGPPR